MRRGERMRQEKQRGKHRTGQHATNELARARVHQSERAEPRLRRHPRHAQRRAPGEQPLPGMQPPRHAPLELGGDQTDREPTRVGDGENLQVRHPRRRTCRHERQERPGQ